MEMVVSVAVTGIAIAGLGELLWINGAFSNRLFNKIDNMAAAKNFYEILGKDVRTAMNVGNQQTSTTSNPTVTPSDSYISSSATYELNCTTLVLQIPYVPSDGTVPNEAYLQGYPIESPSARRPVLDTVIYNVETTPEGTTGITRYFFPDPTYPANGNSARAQTSACVLNSLVGPTDANGLNHVFDYVQVGGSIVPSTAVHPFSSNSELLSAVNAVMVNLEAASSSTVSGTISNTATVGLRREFYMRNTASANGRHS
jgi:hypothetical protein